MGRWTDSSSSVLWPDELKMLRCLTIRCKFKSFVQPAVGFMMAAAVEAFS